MPSLSFSGLLPTLARAGLINWSRLILSLLALLLSHAGLFGVIFGFAPIFSFDQLVLGKFNLYFNLLNLLFSLLDLFNLLNLLVCRFGGVLNLVLDLILFWFSIEFWLSFLVEWAYGYFRLSVSAFAITLVYGFEGRDLGSD